MGNSGLNFVSSLIGHNFIVQVIMGILLLLSIYSWAVILNKRGTLKKQFKIIKTLNKSIEKSKNKDLASIMACFTAYAEKSYAPIMKFLINNKDSVIKCDAQTSIIVEKSYSELYSINSSIESRLDTLATIGSTAPFIGLLGTVIGIIDSFTAIAATSSVSLASIAPGISEALFATAVGLFVAIPAVFAYNIFSKKIDTLKIEQDILLQDMVFLLHSCSDKKDPKSTPKDSNNKDGATKKDAKKTNNKK